MKRTLVEANIPEWRKKASRTKSGLPGKHRLREKRLLTARAPAHVPRYTLYDVETSFLRASVCIMRPIVKTAKKGEQHIGRALERLFCCSFSRRPCFLPGARTYFLFETERPGFKETSKKLCFSVVQTPRCEKLAESPARTVSKVGE